MQSEETILNDNLVYSSPRIFERRRRILATTRELISIHGYDGFSIRELCTRAGVAPQTVYKAFENKERLVALSIREHFSHFSEAWPFRHDGATFRGVIERLIVHDSNMPDARKFVMALVAIYFSPTAGMDLRVAARTNIVLTLGPWAGALADRGELRPGVTTEGLVDAVGSLLFKRSLDWCRGDLSDSEYLFKKLEGLLTYAAGAVQGEARQEVETYLADLFGKGDLIAALRTEAIQPAGRA